MPSAAENLEEEALQSDAMVTGDEVLGKGYCNGSAWKAVRHRTCLNHPTSIIALVSIRAIRGQKIIRQALKTLCMGTSTCIACVDIHNFPNTYCTDKQRANTLLGIG